MTGRTVEIISIAVIALAILFGGRTVLVQISQYHGAAALGLAAIGLALTFGVRRDIGAGGPTARLAATRTIAFAAAVAAAISFVLWPARWSIGACIAALEFGLILELLGKLAPAPAAPAPPPPAA